MENVTLDLVYKHILHIEERLENLEGVLQIPEIQLTAAELKKHNETLKRMTEGKEGTRWEAYKQTKR